MFKQIAASGLLIGDIADTQEMLALPAKNVIDSAEKRSVRADEKGNVRYRYVIDMAKLMAERDKIGANGEKPGTPTRSEPANRRTA